MKLTAPIGATPLDAQPHGLVGQPLDRVDGPLKVHGSRHLCVRISTSRPAKPLYAFIVAPSGDRQRPSSTNHRRRRPQKKRRAF